MKCLYGLLLLGVLGLCMLGMPREAAAKSRIELWYPYGKDEVKCSP